MRRKPFVMYLPLYAAILVAILWSWQTVVRPAPAGEPVVEAWMLNVGQGESVLLREPTGKKLLFDGGPNDTVLSELGAVLPATDRTIDLMILSHNHSDHIRGLISILERYDVKEVWVSGAVHGTADFTAFQEALKNDHLTPKIVFAPKQADLGELHLRVYHPINDMSGTDPDQQHDATVSVKASFGSEDIFLTGDLDEAHEADMIAACPPPDCSLEAEVLQVPHHGSATGLAEDFLTAVHPQIALIPVGLNNKFDHPRQVILDRLNAHHVPYYRTDLQRRIHVVLRKTGISVVAEQSAPQ